MAKRAVLGEPHGTTRLIALLLRRAGLRVLGCLTLRMKDVDFAFSKPALEQHLARGRALHARPAR